MQGGKKGKLTSEGHSDLLVHGVEDLDLHGVNDGGDDASPSLAPISVGAIHQVPPYQWEEQGNARRTPLEIPRRATADYILSGNVR